MTSLARWFGVGVRASWHFLVGDAPEFVAVVTALVIYALMLRHFHLAVVYGLPALVVGALSASVYIRRRSLQRRAPEVVGVTETTGVRE